MRNWILFIGLLLAAGPLLAQFTGGPGDGSDASRALQLDLEGIPSGTRPLYAGGPGDGYVAQRAYAGLGDPVNSVAIFAGGIGDGYSLGYAAATLAGKDLTQLYGGGAGDGFDRQSASFAPNGQSVAALYSGGGGDGYADLRASVTPGGLELAQLYGGGPGDGYAQFSASELLGMAMTMLYGGGTGDGFDRRTASFSLSGTNLAGLYGGGPGDGSDQTLFFGVLPLPLTLISFDAFPTEEYVLLRWVTEDEVATDFFTIEKTRDGRGFDWVGEETAAGYSLSGEQLHYELKDASPSDGTSYYRLKTTDFDGTISLSHLVEVNYAVDRDWGFQLFPNPNTGRHFNLRLAGISTGEQLKIEVVDAAGRILHRENIQAGSIADHRFDLRNRLTPGSYLIRVIHPRRGAEVKLLVVGE